jgi:beta-lactamase regulating signal transducer with metallopeptidase domain
VFLFYQFVLRKLTFYDCNRWYFLGYTLVCFFIPFIDISPVLQKNDWTNSTAVAWVPLIGEYHITAISAHRSYNFFTAWNIVSLIVIAGMLVMFLRLLFQLVSFRRMMQKAKAIPAANINLFHVDENIIPFSFGNAIFLNQHLHSTEELQDIIRHEFVHVKQKHSLDIIWGELLCLVNWYNPFAWLLKRSIRQNLEFIADSTVLQNGIDKKQYQYLLLKVIGNNQFSIASKFNFSSLKKRIAMMNKLKTAKLHLVRFLFILPLLAVILLSFRKQTGDSIANNKNKESTIALPGGFTDTIPGELNEKGYIIDVTGRRGNATVVVKDKNGKVVERISYSKWSDNEKFYTGKYGELPPPPLPPLPPTPPDPPQPMELPDNVKKIDVNDKKATVTLKDGKVEKYDLNKPEEKASFEKKYGEIIPTPPTPPTPPTRKNGNEISAVQEVSRAALSDNFEITDKKATMHLKDGKTEEYDLTNSAERNKFQTKYGKIIEVGERVEGVNEPVTVVGYSINKNTSNEPITVVGYPINMKVSSKPVSVISAEGTRSVIAPTRIAGEAGVTFLNGEGKVISGEEEILVTITKKTTQQQLEGLVKQMKEKGVEIKFDNIDYNDGILVGISGTIKFKDSNGSFSATDFNKLILSTIKDGEHFYFKVRTTDNKQVI